MKKLIVLLAAVLTAGCATTSFTLHPPSGGTAITGKKTFRVFEPNQIEITLDGKTYRGEWSTGAASGDMPAVSWPHKRHTGRAHAELTAEDGSRLSCHWIFHGGEGGGTCKGTGAREYKLTTQ